MDILEAIDTRYSVRAFKPEPVPKEILEKLLTVSLRAPSWANMQTWEFAVVGGDVMKDLRETLAFRVLAHDKRKPDIPYPEWGSPYKERRRENGQRLFEMLGIHHDDVEKRLMWYMEMYRFFNAPNAIIIYTDNNLGAWAVMNVGIVAQTISLSALGYGLGSIMMAAGISYPDTVRQKLNIPESKQLLVAIAIGYPDVDSPTNKFRSNRVPLAEVCTWHGL